MRLKNSRVRRILKRRAQVHRAMLVAHVTAYDQQFRMLLGESRGLMMQRARMRVRQVCRRLCATKARRRIRVSKKTSSGCAAREMREGLSNSHYRMGVQTTGSCFGTMAEVVSVSEKAGLDPVR